MKGEFDFIKDIRKSFPAPEGILGIGDDCSVIPESDLCETLVSTDMLIEGTHFLAGEISPYLLGWKAAAASFSDIAAMGASPLGSFLALAVPQSLDETWSGEFLRGYAEISRLSGFPLLGGDTTCSLNGISICVTVLGRALRGKSLKRNGAKSGDLICVSGPLGDSAAGLEAILRGLPREEPVPFLIERHYRPQPRIREGISLARTPGIHSMMDISDGLASDILHIMEESGVGAEIDTARIPLSPEFVSFCAREGLDPIRLALEGGEDYELLFTADISAAIPIPHTVVGRITTAPVLKWIGTDGSYRGYTHFSK